LLTHDWCGKVTMNVKAEPMFVSDAITPDVLEHIAEMQRSTRAPEVQALGQRLADYVKQQRLVVRTDLAWNRYLFFHELPAELQTRLAQEATLVIVKGDLNYRRLLCDRQWPASTPMEDVAPYFPTAFVAFRTMKSNLVAGIPAHVVAEWEKEDPQWPFNGSGGKRALIQSVLPVECQQCRSDAMAPVAAGIRPLGRVVSTYSLSMLHLHAPCTCGRTAHKQFRRWTCQPAIRSSGNSAMLTLLLDIQMVDSGW
jgi:hypothetical protein